MKPRAHGGSRSRCLRRHPAAAGLRLHHVVSAKPRLARAGERNSRFWLLSAAGQRRLLEGLKRACTHKIANGDSDLISVLFGSLCGLKSNISRGPESAFPEVAQMPSVIDGRLIFGRAFTGGLEPTRRPKSGACSWNERESTKRLPSGIRISERRAPVKPIAPRSVPDADIGSTSPVGKSTLWLVAHNYHKLGAVARFRTWSFV